MAGLEFRDSIMQEKKKLLITRNIVGKAWEKEIKCYEQDQRQQVNVQELNPRLFPYDKACYFLLDMYMCVEEDFPYVLPCYVDEMARRRDDFILEESYLPSSSFSVWFSLVPKHRSPKYSRLVSSIMDGFRTHQMPLWISDSNSTLASDFSFLDEWIESIEDELSRNSGKKEHQVDCDISHLNDYFRIPVFENLKRGIQTKVLLKLLKHSMSELQRDHRLATTVLLALVEYRCFEGDDGLDAFRYFLVTVESEFISKCDESCFHREGEETNHVCPDWQKFRRIFKIALGFGHAEVISTFVDSLLESVGWGECDNLQNLIGWDPDDDPAHSIDLLSILIQALVDRNHLERRKIFELIRLKYKEKSLQSIPEEDLNASVSSHRMFTQAIIDVGKSVLLRCPANPTTETIGSIVASGLLITTIIPPLRDSSGITTQGEGRYLGKHEFFPSFIDAERYADAISQATTASMRKCDNFRKACGIHRVHNLYNDDIVQSLFLAPPSDEIQTIMKGLFLRQLVETHEAGFGYGDFLAWSGLPICPYEPMLYEPNMNYPDLNGYDFTEILDEETNKVLNIQDIRARYDLSLLFLRRAWSMPWSPSNHLSFQDPFRQAVRTAALCSHRLGMPLELCLTVNSFLSREWWPDDRRECWLYECQIKSLEKKIRGETGSDEPKSLIKCKCCMVACACSKKHLKKVLQEGHQRLCTTPPMRVPTKEDLLFCSQYLGHANGDKTGCSNNDKENTEYSDDEAELCSEDDENADWVSVESSSSTEEVIEFSTKTELVKRYFEKNSYKIQRREEHAFASHYVDT